MGLPHNPIHEKALSIEDLSPDASFAVIKAGETVLRGTFVGATEYTEEGGWSDIPARTSDGKEIRVSLYDTGIVCRPNGEWQPETFVLRAVRRTAE